MRFRRSGRARENDPATQSAGVSEQGMHERAYSASGQSPVSPSISALIAIRDPHLRDELVACLRARGVHVVGIFADGAAAAESLPVEKPDLVIVQDGLTTVSSLDVVRRAQAHAPHAIIGARIQCSTVLKSFVDAGTHALFTARATAEEITEQLLTFHGRDLAWRKIPPDEIADRLWVGLVDSDDDGS